MPFTFMLFAVLYSHIATWTTVLLYVMHACYLVHEFVTGLDSATPCIRSCFTLGSPLIAIII